MEETIQTRTKEEIAARATIDWGGKKHFWRVLAVGSTKPEVGQMEATPEAIDVWATMLYERFGGRPVAVCLEQSHIPVIYTLLKYGHLRLFTIHSKTAADYRKMRCPSGAKDDNGDTESLMDVFEKHPDLVQELKPDTAETRLLRLLVENRRTLVDEKTRLKNRLTACLKMYFPQVLGWFDSVESALVAAVLERFGSLEELKRAHPGTLKKFFHEHNCRGEERIRERIASIQAAMPATDDGAILEGKCWEAKSLARLIATLRTEIDQFDTRIAVLLSEHADASLFASLPGAGAALVPRLIVAFGTDRERWENAYQIQCFSGIGPVTEQSGKKRLVHVRWACPKFMRQTFHEFAAQSIKYSEWARVFYDVQRNEKKNFHHAAVRALAFKWIRIIFRCWKSGKPYDERTYIESLQKRNSPLIGAFLPATLAKWKAEGGFQKLSANLA